MKTTTLKTKAMSILLAIVMLLGMLPMSAFAADTKPSHVALGDSISTGYGLADKTTQGFTYMLANSLGYELTNLAVDGNTAEGILAQLEDSEDTSVKTAVANADLITITAGGNDLMAALYEALADYYNTQYGLTGDAAVSGNDIVDAFAGNDSNLSLTITDMNAMLGIVANFATTQNFTDALDSYTTNMFGDRGVIKTILALNPHVKIVVMTQYNPYIVFDGAFLYGNLYTGIEAGLSGDNGLNAVINSNAASEGYIVADVYTAFKNSSDNLCNAGTVDGKTNLDFHPNAAGHAIIADTFAAAVPMPEVYIGGIGMADGTYLANGATATTTTAPASGGYAYYKDGTLTLSNYSYSGEGYWYATDYSSVIYAPGELKIVLVGQSSITNTEDYCDGITVEEDLTISGEGALSLYADYGIYSRDITINGGSLDVIVYDEGFHVYDGDFTINGGVLNVIANDGIEVIGSVYFNGGVSTIDASHGYMTVNSDSGIYLKDGMKILQPEDTVIEDDYGYYFADAYGETGIRVAIGPVGTALPEIYVGGVGMADGTYLANGATATTTTAPASGGYAYYNDGVLTLNNYEYEGEGYWYATDYSSVIYAPGELKIVLVGQSSLTNTEYDGDGITPEADLTISGNGSIDITSEHGIYAWDSNITIEGGRLGITGEYSGIYADDDITINGGILDIAAESGIESGYGSVSFNGGTTTVDSRVEYGIAVEASVDINLSDENGVEILEPEGAEVYTVTDGGTDYNVIQDSDGNWNIRVVIGTKNVAPEALTGTVTISGDMQVGSRLTATVTDTNNTGELSYQWYRYVENNTAIEGATSSTYTLTADDIGFGIYCVVSSSVQTGTIQEYAGGTVKKKEIGISWGNTSFTYNGSAQKPTATATGTLNNDIITLTVEVSGESVNAGEYIATVTGITGENAGNYRLPSNVTKTFTIGKVNQNKPTVSKTDETISNKKDGTISGVDTTMEYRKDGENTYTAISGNTVENLAASKYYVRVKGDDNHNPSAETEVIIAAGGKLAVTVPQNQVGYTLTADKTELEWHGSTTLAFALADGYSKTDEFSVSATGATLTDNGNGTYTISNAEDNVIVTVKGVADTTAPEAEISISTNKWTEFLNNITFGLFFKETETVTITATDKGSGVDKIYYLISNDKLTEEDVEALADVFWTEYDTTNKPSISPDKECIVYVKVIDKAQNVKVISSDGLVFDGTAPTLEGIENGKTYYGDLTVIIPADQFGDIDQVTLDGETMNFAEGTYGRIPADNKEHTVIATDKAGNKTEYRITVYKVYEITFNYSTFELGFPVNYGASFNAAHPDTVQNMVAEKEHHTFIGWYESTDGGETLQDTPYDFDTKVTGDVILYPLFEKTTYTVDIGECHYVGCVISGGGSYQHGQTVTVTATPTDGTGFKYWLNADIAAGWDDDPSEAELKAAIVSYDATYTFTAEKDVSLEAVFSGSDEIAITAMLIAGTDEKNLLDAEWMDVKYDFGTVTPGAEQITLPGEIVKDIVVIGDKQYQFKGFIVFGYDEATDTETAELKETLTIGKMPLYGSAEYWDWFNSISDGIYAAYMEYTPEDDDGDDPQSPTDPETPDDPQKPSSPQTGDNSNMPLWIALLFISGGAVITLTVYDRKRRTVNR